MSKKNPFIPLNKANIVVVDNRIDEESKLILKKMGLKVITTTKCEDVHKGISYHPDIVMHPVNHNTLVVAPNVFDYYEEMFFGMGIKLIKGEKRLSRNYPNDISYNVGRVHGYAVHNFKYTDEKLLFYLKKENLDFIDIKQGYSKCSMAVVDESAIITSDCAIQKKLIPYGIDVLLIQPGHIILEGFDYGFIGGCCGNLSKNDIVFSGELDSHPDSYKVFAFLKKYKKNVYFLSKNKLVDLGTIITLYCK